MAIYRIESNGPLLKGSVVVKEQEFKGYTESYETETFDWDHIGFE